MSKERTEFTENLKWNVKDLYSSTTEWKEDCNYIEKKLPELLKYKGHILDNSNNLYEVLNLDNELSQKIERAYIYAHIQNDEDTRNTTFQTMYGKIYNLYVFYSESASFITPEILSSDYKQIDKYINEFPKLKEYERSIKEIFRLKDHVLSEEVEKVLSTFSSITSIPSDAFSSLTDADMKFGKITNSSGVKEELNESNYRTFIESGDRRVRKQAFTKLLNTYGLYKNTYATLLSGEVKKNNRLAKIKKYNSSLEASLNNFNIPTEIYDNLIDTVKKNIKPLSKFWKLKKQALGLYSIHLYDQFAPITNEVNKKYTIEEAKELLMKSLSVLGDEYINDLSKAFDERWIDFCPNQGKRGGAYCTCCYQVHPYVLLSYNGLLNDVSTLAHELGHAMHYYYACKNQKYQDYEYSIFVAEVASQVNQILLSKYLINNTNDVELKKYLIDDLIRDFKSTVYRQTMFAEFEKTISSLEASGEILTHEVLSDIYYKLNKEYNGKSIVIDSEIKYEWARIPHFYMFFYVYQYATAYIAAINLSLDILNNKEKAVQNYLEFLSLGCTKNPIESLKIAGVDITSEFVINNAFSYFDDLVNELSSLYKA